MKKRQYKPRCSCQLRLVDGRCPEGCTDYKKPAAAIRLSEKGRKEEGRNSGYLSAQETDRGLAVAMNKLKVRSV